jgi:maleate isomerase
MKDSRRIGMLTPSSNSVLEPLTARMLADVPGVTAHFQRFRVVEISTSEAALAQFDFAPLLEAALLLADARVHAICWNGTSGGWLGLDIDRELCRRITEATGIPATTSTLALLEILERTRVKRLAWATPYLDEIQARILATFAAAGFPHHAERHLKDPGNFSFSEIGEDRIERMVRELATAGADAITIFCTNLRGMPLVERLEAELGVPIYDTVATALWKALMLVGVDPAVVTGWGRLFRELR